MRKILSKENLLIKWTGIKKECFKLLTNFGRWITDWTIISLGIFAWILLLVFIIAMARGIFLFLF